MGKKYDAPPPMNIDPEKTYLATLKTDAGDIQVELLASEAPLTVNNFVFLARDGYYDGVVFHRVIDDFVIQGGDPTGTGSGGPGYKFADELPPKRPYGPGVLAMANAGPNTNGSQFFIGSGPGAGNLNRYPNYTVFGQVAGGMEVVRQIATAPVGPGGGGEMSRPRNPVKIQSVEIEEK